MTENDEIMKGEIVVGRYESDYKELVEAIRLQERNIDDFTAQCRAWSGLIDKILAKHQLSEI